MAGPFEGILGGNCELKILEFLLPLKDMDFNISELAEEAEVSRPTANNVIKKFVEWGIMEVSQRRGGNDYYQINPDSPFVIAIENFNNTIIEHILGEETLHEIHDYWKQHAPKPSAATTSVEAKPEMPEFSPEVSDLGILQWCGNSEPKKAPAFGVTWPIGLGEDMYVAN